MPDTQTTHEAALQGAFAAGPVRVVPGESGPGLIFRGAAIHDPSSPMEEAALWVNQALGVNSRGEPPKLALVFGLGLGWHIRRLHELFPGIKVAVFEPDKGVIPVFEKYNALSRGQEPKIFLDFERFASLVAQDMVHGESGFPVVLMVPGYAMACPEEAARFKGLLDHETARLKVILKTRQATSSAFMENLTANAGLAPKLPDLMLLRDRMPPYPAFCVGAGPSLTLNGGLLKEAAGKSLIIAAGAALKPLLSLGVSPDIVIVIESSDTSRFLKLTDAEKEILRPGVILALAMGSHPKHFECQGFQKAVFHLSGGEAQLLSQGLFLPQGGNAGSAAFALAYCWGLNPLILVGQDQAYLGAQLHAEGTADSVIEAERPDSIIVPGVGGARAETNTSLLASINWFQEAAAIAARRPDGGPRLINASASGASLRGFAEAPLEPLVKSLPERPLPWSLPDLIESLPRPTARELRGDLKQMSHLITQIRQLARRKIQSALGEMVNISKVSAFMRQILGPAMAGGHPAQILKNLTWADGVILKMLASLERHAGR